MAAAAAMKLNSLVRRASSSLTPPLSMMRSQSNNNNGGAIFPLNPPHTRCLLGGQFLRFSTTLDYNTDYNIGSLVNLVFERTGPYHHVEDCWPREYHLQVLHGDTYVPVMKKLDHHFLTKVVVLGDTYQVDEEGIPSVSMNSTLYFGELDIEFEAIAEPGEISIQSIKMSDGYGDLRFLHGYLSLRGIDKAMVGTLFRCFGKQT